MAATSESSTVSGASGGARERVEVGGYALFPLERLGCAQLARAEKLGSSEALSGKLFGAEKLPEYLSLEGSVHRVLRAHPHPHLLSPLTVASSPDGLHAVVFPALGEDLHSYVRAAKGLPEREAKSIFRAILSAVAHCHRHRIVLRDLRLGKIFFKRGSKTEIVIGDLDGAQVVPHSAPFLSDRKGSPAFVSPEVLVSQSFDGAAADMWALGVMLYILLTGTYPFQDTQLATLFHKIQQGHAAVHFPSGMGEAPRDIIRSLLVREPHLRLTAAQLQTDLWLEDLPPPPALQDWMTGDEIFEEGEEAAAAMRSSTPIAAVVAPGGRAAAAAGMASHTASPAAPAPSSPVFV